MVKKSSKVKYTPSEEELAAEAMSGGQIPTQSQKPTSRGKKGERFSNEYNRGISKIASYTGTVRAMKIKDGKMRDSTGKEYDSPYDEIINIYVNPGGEVLSYDRNSYVNTTKGVNSISKQKVRDEGAKDKAIWYAGESARVASRKKKVVKLKTKRTPKKIARR